MDRLSDTINTSGNLEIWKVYDDGNEELFFSDHNIIVSGMSAAFLSLFGGMTSNDIRDFQIRYFQLGTGVYEDSNITVNTNQLSAPITFAQYDPSGTAALVVSSVNVRAGDTITAEAAVEIPWQHIKRASPTSVLYTLILDKDAVNGITLREIGLFMRSPLSNTIANPMLAAYKKYPSLTKNSEFSLIYKWTLYF